MCLPLSNLSDRLLKLFNSDEQKNYTSLFCDRKSQGFQTFFAAKFSNQSARRSIEESPVDRPKYLFHQNEWSRSIPEKPIERCI